MEWQTDSVTEYRCPKCRNNVAIARKITLPSGLLPELLARGGSKYRFVTCSLCGYTEIYDLSVYAEKRAAKTTEGESSNLAPET